MNNPSNFRNKIQNILELLQEANISIFINTVSLSRLGTRIVRVTWPDSTNTPRDLFRSSITDVETYLGWLECGAYSALLFDGSILQLSYVFDGDVLKEHRLAFWPCPYLISTEELLEDSPYEVALLCKSVRPQRTIAPLRFDYDRDAASDDHAASHFTFNHDDCRLPVSSPLTPEEFIAFVFKRFYYKQWKSLAFLRHKPSNKFKKCIGEEHEQDFHLSPGLQIFSL